MKTLPAWFTLSVLGTALILACVPRGEAAPTSRDRSRCFRAEDVTGFASPRRDAVDVQVLGRGQYRLTLAGDCPGASRAIGIAIQARGGGARICEGRRAELIVPDALGPRRCLVRTVRRLTATERRP